jgi:DNA-binding transcriptional LysR family regulator
MGFDTVTLHCFISLAQTCSFTKAAEMVGRSQSAVSQQIAKLEQILGKPLIKRGSNMVLTHDGQIFLEYAKRIFALHNEILDRFKQPALHGTLHFGLPEAFASMFLSEVLLEFKRLHPRVTIIVECDLTRNLLERFRRKEFDLVLAKSTIVEDFPHGVEVHAEKLEWVGNKMLLEFYQEDDVPMSLVLSPDPCVYRARAIQSLDKLSEPWRIVFSSHSYAGIIAAVKAGMGITVLPKNMIPPDLDILHSPRLPILEDAHISLLNLDKENPIVKSFESFVVNKLQQ